MKTRTLQEVLKKSKADFKRTRSESPDRDPTANSSTSLAPDTAAMIVAAMSSQMAALAQSLEKKFKRGTEPEDEEDVTTKERLSQPDDEEDVDWGSQPEASQKKNGKKEKKKRKE